MTLSKSFIFIFCALHLFAQNLWAQKKARVLQPETEVYTEADFDSDVAKTINPNDVFIISSKPYGPFYKVKLSDGTIGYIPDTELNIEGQGPFQPKPFVDDEDNQKSLKNKKSKKKIQHDEDDETDEIQRDLRSQYHGVTIQLVNFHENTMGAVQVADLFAIGYRYQAMPSPYESALSYEVLLAPKVPEYYSQKTGAKTTGGILWGSWQVSNVGAMSARSSLRYGAGPFLRYSHFALTTAQRTYSLQDLTLGLDLQLGIILHNSLVSADLGLRYFWEKEPYGGLGLTLLF